MPRQSLDDIIVDAAVRAGMDPGHMKRVAKIESGMDPNNRTGSYRGLFQLSPSEFARGGGRGNIYDPVQNANSAATIMAQQSDRFAAKYGRRPDPTEAYMMHQQGEGGLDAHLANPNQPAWVSMWSTGEGQQKGQEWAKRAIWGNIPDSLKAQYGNVNNVTSSDFINNVWRPKVEGGGVEEHGTGSPAGPPVQARDVPETPMLAAATGSSTGLPEGYTASGPGSLQAKSIANLDLGTKPPSQLDRGATGLGFGGISTAGFPTAQGPGAAPTRMLPIPTQLAALPPSLLHKYGRGG